MFAFWMLYIFVWQYSPISNQLFEIMFKTSPENFPLQNLEFDLRAKNFFVSGKNVLYKFSENKSIPRLTKRTGPEAHCLEGLPPEEVKAFCGDDYNSVMVVTMDSLITCSSLRGGLCVKRNKTSLEILPTAKNIRLVSNGSQAIGIFVNVSDRSNNGRLQHIVLFAKQYTEVPLPLSKLEKSAIFSVSPNLSAKVLGDTDLGNHFDLFLKFPQSQMDYRVVLENEKFVFILLNQNSNSRLVKICKSIDSSSSKKVYEDIPIICNINGTYFTRVEHGSFVSVFGKKLLVILFSNLATEQSAVCVFDENEIYEAFLVSRKHRFGCPKHDLQGKDLIFDGDSTYFNRPFCTHLPLNKTDESFPGFYEAFNQGDFCNDVDSRIPQFGIIVGLLPLIGRAVYTSKSHKGTVIGSTSIFDLLSFYIGTNKGYVIQILYDPDKKITTDLMKFRVDSSEIMAIKNGIDATYIMSQNKIVKMLRKNCSQYPDICQKCVDARNGNCGLGEKGGFIMREKGVCFLFCFTNNTSVGEQNYKVGFLITTILSATLGITLTLAILLYYCKRRHQTDIKADEVYLDTTISGRSEPSYDIMMNGERFNHYYSSVDDFARERNINVVDRNF